MSLHPFHSPMLVVDTETTGIMQDWVRIVDIGAVLVDENGQGVAAFSQIVCPNILDERAAPALAVNHLTYDQIKAAPRLHEVTYAFRQWVASLGGVHPIATAYNVSFDKHHCDRDGFALRWGPCVYQMSKKIMGRSFKLTELAPVLGVPVYEPAHRALTDAYTAAAVAVELARRHARTPA